MSVPNFEVHPQAVASPSDDFERKLELLRDQVDVLQTSAAEGKRPWYRDASIILSVLALVLSCIFSVQALYQQHVSNDREEQEKIVSERKERLEQLRELLVQITDARNEEAQELATLAAANPVLFQQRSAIRNNKRLIMLESAGVLAASLRGHLSSNVMSTLAFEHAMDSDWEPAERYYRQAAAAATNGMSRAGSRLGLAAVYMTPGSTRHDVARGRVVFQELFAILASRQDEYARQQRAYTYANFAWLEMLNGNAARGSALVAKARQEIAAMNLLNPARQQLLAGIDSVYDSSNRLRTARDPATSPLKRLEGRWALQFDGAVDAGELVLIPGTATTPALASVDVFSNGGLARKYNGVAVADGAESIRIDWSGARPHPMGSLVQIAGVTTVRLACAGGRPCGTETTVGEKSLSFTLKRR